jgi:DNA mismatch repair protein MutS2
LHGKTIKTLELDKIIGRLVNCTSSPLGRNLAENLLPSTDEQVIARGQALTAEGVELLTLGQEIPLGGIKDIGQLVRRAGLGAQLAGEELLAVKETLEAGGRLARYFRDKEGRAPLLTELARDLPDFRGLIDRLAQCLTDEGELRDEASPTLAQIRANQRNCQNRIREQLDGIMRSQQWRKLLQEPIVTVRHGRYVVPVKQEYRHAVRGIIHDQSASGATLFIEPTVIVNLNNRLRELEQAEDREIDKILWELSTAIAARVDEIQVGLEILAQLDFHLAKGRLALEMDALPPVLKKSGEIRIIKGRHPLLGSEVVPIDIYLGGSFRTLVVTGPNTGGKTVTLKTIGLFALMAQCGLHIPAGPGSELVVFQRIFADIGDEQSIEQNLSTFSSHLTNIVQILRQARKGDLVLLDEIGAGTDPTEGAALAMALLEEFHQRGCLTVATTHYSELKAFAYSQEGMENASVQFDVSTLQPTFELAIGVPGRSNAFPIAKRLRVPAKVIRRAQEFLTTDEIKVEDLIRQLETDGKKAAQARIEAERLKREAQTLKEAYEEKLAHLMTDRNEILAKARGEAEELLKQARLDLDQLVGELRRQSRAEALEEAAREARQQLATQREAIKEKLGTVQREKTERQPLKGLQVGDPVQIISLGQQGVVLAPPQGDSVLVQVGGIKLHARLTDLRRTGGQQPSKEKSKTSSYGRLMRGKALSISPEIHLRGLPVDEALGLADKYLDDAFLANLGQVRIIHGKGTGTLRGAIHELLDGHPHVRSYRMAYPEEGGMGVTVVSLHGS